MFVLAARAPLLPVVVLFAFVPTSAAAQELVIVTESTKQYHRPACAVVREAPKDIMAMTVGQAEARGYKAHRACDPANPANKVAQPAPGSTAGSAPQPPIFVYTAPGDTRYHRETCAKLSKDRKRVSLEEAGKKHWPCAVCRPPIRKRTPAIPSRYGRE